MRSLLGLAITLTAVSSFAAQDDARVVLSGHVRPALAAASDLGRVDASLVLRHVTLLLQPSAAQQADLERLLADQQDSASPLYHQWLTPEQYGARFGLPDADVAQVTSWLASRNLTVDSVGRGRTTIAFTGAVRDVEAAFGTEIHRYSVNGETHFANAGEPSVPAALGGMIRVIHGLDDFKLKPRSVKSLQPIINSPLYTSLTTGYHFLAPEDVSTIFDIAPLYNSGYTGKGLTIAVVGQTAINLSDIQEFRTYFNLSANDPKLVLVPNTGTPGISTGDLGEADLDLEWSGAIARDASILFVYSNDVVTSVAYAIDQNLAPVISMSYGECEALAGSAGLSTMNSYAQQASAQGISWINAAGDNGANDCFGQASRVPNGLSVDEPASVPYVTGVGGTTLTEGIGNYWNATNSGNHASALSYIPENVWNDSVADGTPSAGGGGASTSFGKPTWQTGQGVPSDGARDVPDVAMPGSADHDGYMVYSAGELVVYGGTSVGAPVFAGITGLLNQYLVANGLQKTAGLGSLNPQLYALAKNVPGAFHDITVGNNKVVACGSASCSATLVGYNAGTGYDQASGLGSVDAFNFVASWSAGGSSVKTAPVVQLTSSVSALPATASTVLTATVTAVGGNAPTGSVTFWVGGTALGTTALSGAGSAALTVTGSQLSAGAPETTALAQPASNGDDAGLVPIVSAVYSGDSVFAGAAATTSVTVLSATALAVSGVTSAASYQRSYAPGMIVALFGANLSGSTPAVPGSPLPTQLGGTTVTLNGIAAPLYYVSPTQINFQIPYSIAGNTSAVVKVTSNGQTGTSQMPISVNAPEIFADGNNLMVPYQTTGRGDTVYLFATGDGLFTTPQVTTGAVPSAGTLSVAPTSAIVTVGGVMAATTFVGVPAWSIGVTQINFTIPANAPLGKQPVEVIVGSGISSPVYVTVTP